MTSYIDNSLLYHLNLPKKDSHKNQNGRLMIIGGSKLFHGASLFALKTASRIVDMVLYSSIEENLELTKYLNRHLYSFIAIAQDRVKAEIETVDAVLIGPGMVRGSKQETGTGESGAKTRAYVLELLQAFPDKKWIIDAGALQMMTIADLKKLTNLLITPHQGELKRLLESETDNKEALFRDGGSIEEKAKELLQVAMEIGCVIVLKGTVDIIVDGRVGTGNIHSLPKMMLNQTGNEGMTKGGTGDVLAGLIAALACTNDLLVAAAAGSYINGLAGDQLYQSVGPYFNADQLADLVPVVLWNEINADHSP